jgi:hypothetical protein
MFGSVCSRIESAVLFGVTMRGLVTTNASASLVSKSLAVGIVEINMLDARRSRQLLPTATEGSTSGCTSKGFGPPGLVSGLFAAGCCATHPLRIMRQRLMRPTSIRTRNSKFESVSGLRFAETEARNGPFGRLLTPRKRTHGIISVLSHGHMSIKLRGQAEAV